MMMVPAVVVGIPVVAVGVVMIAGRRLHVLGLIFVLKSLVSVSAERDDQADGEGGEGGDLHGDDWPGAVRGV